MDFLRSHGLPVPIIFGYSAVADNPAGTEYIMELVQGKNLGDVWYTLSEQARRTIVTKLVHLEPRLFGLRFPASGILYYCDDLPDQGNQIVFPSPSRPVASAWARILPLDYGTGEDSACQLSVDHVSRA